MTLPWIAAGTVCARHGGEHIIVEPVAGGRKYLCAACLVDLAELADEGSLEKRAERRDLRDRVSDLGGEVVRLERRYLEETKAHDQTRHRLGCRERELERIRSNMYRERVEAVFPGGAPDELDYAMAEECFSGTKEIRAMICADGKLRVLSGSWLWNPSLHDDEDDLPQEG